jgi:hypothetical protein
VTTLVWRWLTELRNVSAHAGAELTTLPDPLREVVSFARARLAVADDGSLPRTLQRDVLVCLGAGASSSSLDADPEPDLHVLKRAIENSRARVERLLELNAPLVVVLRDASRLRVLECLPPVPAELLTETSTHAPRDTLSDNVGVRREVTLSLLVLRELAGPDPAFEPMLAQLERIRCGAPDDGPNTAAALDAAWAPRTDFAAAVVHYAFCAIDIARGDDERTDQDALYDIAERAIRRRQDASAAPALHAELDAEHRRAWWTKWLLEFVPLAVRTADAPE